MYSMYILKAVFRGIGVGDFKVRWFFLLLNEIRELTITTSESSSVHYGGVTILYPMGKKEGPVHSI
jgi:hypothetical protein